MAHHIACSAPASLQSVSKLGFSMSVRARVKGEAHFATQFSFRSEVSPFAALGRTNPQSRRERRPKFCFWALNGSKLKLLSL